METCEISRLERALEFGYFAKPFGLSLSETFVDLVQAAANAMLAHHELEVYEKALALGASVPEFSSRWGRRH